MRWIAPLLLVAAVAAFVLGVRSGRIAVPERWNPWAPLRLEAPPDTFTRLRLARLSADPAGCRAFLETTPLDYEALPDRATGEGCGFTNAVRVDALPAKVGAPFSLSCRAAASLALWQHHVLEPAAREILGADVARIEHFGSYACRNVNHREGGRRSRHAVAEALDVAGFVLADGRRIRVLKDWPVDSDEARFLHDVRDGACRYFDGVYSPDYNAAHRDHLHLDRGPFRLCR